MFSTIPSFALWDQLLGPKPQRSHEDFLIEELLHYSRSDYDFEILQSLLDTDSTLLGIKSFFTKHNHETRIDAFGLSKLARLVRHRLVNFEPIGMDDKQPNSEVHCHECQFSFFGKSDPDQSISVLLKFTAERLLTSGVPATGKLHIFVEDPSAKFPPPPCSPSTPPPQPTSDQSQLSTPNSISNSQEEVENPKPETCQPENFGLLCSVAIKCAASEDSLSTRFSVMMSKQDVIVDEKILPSLLSFLDLETIGMTPRDLTLTLIFCSDLEVQQSVKFILDQCIETLVKRLGTAGPIGFNSENGKNCSAALGRVTQMIGASDPTTSTISLPSLSIGTLTKIATFLSPCDILSLSSCSRRMRSLACDESLWREACLKDYASSPDHFPPQPFDKRSTHVFQFYFKVLRKREYAAISSLISKLRNRETTAISRFSIGGEIYRAEACRNISYWLSDQLPPGPFGPEDPPFLNPTERAFFRCLSHCSEIQDFLLDSLIGGSRPPTSPGSVQGNIFLILRESFESSNHVMLQFNLSYRFNFELKLSFSEKGNQEFCVKNIVSANQICSPVFPLHQALDLEGSPIRPTSLLYFLKICLFSHENLYPLVPQFFVGC